MNKVKVIARREFAEVLRTKMFWIGMLLPLVVMIVVIVAGGKHSDSTSEKDVQGLRIMGAFMYLFVMFISMMSTSQMLLTTLIEEKGSRVVEVLLSAASPFELMAGKIVGLVGVGLTSAAVFVTAVSIAAGSTGALKAPDATLVVLFLVYYLLGFVMYASIYAGVGAAFSTLKDAQTVMMPLSLLLILPLMFWMQIAKSPNGPLAVALSLFPPTAPTVMILRVVVLPSPPWLEIAGSLLLLAASVPCIVWAAAKIFRTGILLYGKPPKLGEILRWIRSE